MNTSAVSAAAEAASGKVTPIRQGVWPSDNADATAESAVGTRSSAFATIMPSETRSGGSEKREQQVSRPAARHTEALARESGMGDNEIMTDQITRPELDAKLETIEARMDGRIARIEDAVQRISEDNAATRAGISSLKTTLIVTAIGAVLTIVLGVAAFNATLQSNMLSAFQAGQQVSQQK